MTQPENWDITANRFVAFFDILGFKDLVMRSTHQQVLDKLAKLKSTISKLEQIHTTELLKKYNIDEHQSKSVTFSDSLIFFSKGDTFNDGFKILLDSLLLMTRALADGIAIKGAISFGHVTVDFANSLFFGQPIIDAYLLHEDLQMLTVVCDNHFDVKLRSFEDSKVILDLLVSYKANMKSGRITHTLMRPQNSKRIKEGIENVGKLYDQVSGRPRLYVDNTIEFLKSLQLTETVANKVLPEAGQTNKQ